MRILAIDTSTKVLCVAIADDEKVIAESNRLIGYEHSKRLIPAIEGLLKKRGLKIKDVDAFAVGLGPGSFTGLRIGVAAMKGFAFALNKPIAGVSTLDALAIGASNNSMDIYPVIDAKRQNIYWCRYSCQNGSIKRRARHSLTGPEELLSKIKKKSLFLGDGIRAYEEEIKSMLGSKAVFLDERYWYPRARNIARLGYERLNKGDSDSVDTIAPMYMYSKYCQVKK